MTERCRRSVSFTESLQTPSGTKFSRTWSATSLASGEATSVLQSWDVLHATTTQEESTAVRRLSSRSKSARSSDTRMTLPASPVRKRGGAEKKSKAKFDASAVRKINKTYKRVSSGLVQKESFLQKLLTRKATRKASRRTRFGGGRASSTQEIPTDASSDDEMPVNTFSKPDVVLGVRALSPFIPRILRRAIANACSPNFENSGTASGHSSFFEPEMVVIRGAVMVVDVSGFTRLTEQLGKQGNAGIEMLTLVINNYLTKAIEIVEDYDGDVIKFAGDSLIVAFYGDEAELSKEEFKLVLLRALQCADDLSRNLGHVQMSQNGDVLPLSRTPGPSRIKDTLGGWIHEPRKGRSSGMFSRENNLSKKPASSKNIASSVVSMEQSERSCNPSSAMQSVSSPEALMKVQISMNQETAVHEKKLNACRQENPVCFPLESFLWFVKRPKLFHEKSNAEMDINRDEVHDSERLSPRTPDKSDRLLHRGSTFWRDSLTSKRSSATSGFRNILEEEGMSLKVLVGCGDYCMFRVGGVLEDETTSLQTIPRWEYIIADKPNEDSVEIYGHAFRQPLGQIAAIESFAKEGDIIVSLEVLQIADQGFEYETLDGAARILGQLFRQKTPSTSNLDASEFSAIPAKHRRRCAEILRTHVIENIRQKIEIGHLDYVSEIRRLSVLFFGFPGLSIPDEDKAHVPLTNVQKTVETLQRWMREFEGSFVQFRCDEKGFLAICAFGLPNSNHVDNASRAVSAAFKVVGSMNRTGIETCVGITTGDLLCACIGSANRAEYTLFGNAVNLSARLMCKAKKGMGTILCDANTQQKARRKAHYHPLEEVKVKGLENSILIYLVTPLRMEKVRHASETEGPPIPLVGRQIILEGLVKKGKKVMEKEEGGAVVIEGEAGIGKTKLVTEFHLSLYTYLPEYLKHVFYTFGDAEFKSLPLYSWRRVFESMFTYDKKHDPTFDFTQEEGVENSDAHERQGTPLGRVLACRIPHYSSIWRGFLAAALEMELEEMPMADELSSPGNSLDSEVVIQEPSSDFLPVLVRHSTNLCNSPKSSGFPVSPSLCVRDLKSVDEQPTVWHTNPCASMKEDLTGINLKTASIQRRKSTFEFSTLDRRQIILDYLLVICKSFIELYGPVILLLENMHHLDTLSWEFANSVVENIAKGFLLVATIRPHEGSLAPESLRVKGKKTVFEKSSFELNVLLSCPRTETVKLGPFDLETTKELIHAIAQECAVSESVVQYIYSKSNGIPLYVEQITSYLSEQQLLESVILGGALNSNEGLMSFIKENVTIHQMMLDKIDQLRPITHLTLKVASVIGKNITVALLEAVYPFSISQKTIRTTLKELVEAGFLLEDRQQDSWIFRSMLDRDSVNEFVPQSQRRLLHAKVATTLSSGDYTKVPSTTIAYHWSQSCFGCEHLEKEKVLRAIEWWQRSANEAYEKFAFVEALRLYQKAIDYANFLNAPPDRPKSGHLVKLFDLFHAAVLSKLVLKRKIQDSQALQVTKELKATWERRMAQLCLTVMPQATSPGLKTSVLEEASFHALEALKYLNVPPPQSVKARTNRKALNFLPGLKQSMFLRFMDSSRTKRSEEITQLLDMLLQTDPSYLNYVEAIRESYGLNIEAAQCIP